MATVSQTERFNSFSLQDLETARSLPVISPTTEKILRKIFPHIEPPFSLGEGQIVYSKKIISLEEILNKLEQVRNMTGADKTFILLKTAMTVAGLSILITGILVHSIPAIAGGATWYMACNAKFFIDAWLNQSIIFQDMFQKCPGGIAVVLFLALLFSGGISLPIEETFLQEEELTQIRNQEIKKVEQIVSWHSRIASQDLQKALEETNPNQDEPSENIQKAQEEFQALRTFFNLDVVST